MPLNVPDVVQKLFHDVNGDANASHAGCVGAPQVMQRPIGHAGNSIEIGLAL